MGTGCRHPGGAVDQLPTTTKLSIWINAARIGPEREDVPLLPRKYLEKVGAEVFAEAPVGTGPWKFSGRAAP